MNIAVVIITYNPDIYRLRENLLSVKKNKEITYTVIIDNNSNNINDIKLVCSEFSIKLLLNACNKGIGTALNDGFNAVPDWFKWILYLDQDSVIPDDLTKEYSKFLNKNDIAIISPIVIDKRRFNSKCCKKNISHFSYVNQCIQSGALYRISTWKKLRGFNEWLFVDYVDYDYCYRAIENNFKIIKLNNVILDQQFGELCLSPYSKLYESLWKKTHLPIFKKLTYVPNIKPWRMYYRYRNRIYCFKYLRRNKLILEIIKTPFIYAKVVLRSQSKCKVLQQLIKGTVDGIKYRGGK